MIKQILFVFLSAFILFIQYSCVANKETEDQTQGDRIPDSSESTQPSIEITLSPGIKRYTFTQEVAGQKVEREFLVHVPKKINSYMPILFSFHGATGKMNQGLRFFQEAIEENSWVGVYPQGYLDFWNLGQEPSTADDVAFVDFIIKQLKKDKRLNFNQVYAAGFSNGAGMANRLAVQRNYFKGIATLSTMLIEGETPSANGFNPAVLSVHGDQDKIVPYEGGESVTGHKYLSAEKSISTWAMQDNCNAEPQIETLESGNIHFTFEDCQNNQHVEHYRCVGCGHGIGRDFEGGLDQLIMNFFKKNKTSTEYKSS